MQEDPGPLLPAPPNPDGTPSTRSPERTANLIRFQSELEFIQCLSNPLYLHELSTQSYLSQPEFLNYLSYLSYWRNPEYIRFITYPTCLVYLSLLQSESFRARLGDMGFVNDLVRIAKRHHETWRVTRPPEENQKAIKEENLNEQQEPEQDGDDEDGEDGTNGDEGVKTELGGGESGKRRKKRNRTGKSKLGQEQEQDQTPVPVQVVPTDPA